MFKRFVLSMICVVYVVLGITGCSNKPPKYMSQEMYDIGIEAAKVMQYYVDGKMDLSTYENEIEDLTKQAEEYEDDEEYFENGVVYAILSLAEIESQSTKEGETYEQEESLKDLKETLEID